MSFSNINFIRLFFFLRGNEPETRHQPYVLGSPCEDCPNNCEDGLCSKFYVLVCLTLTVDSGVMNPLNQHLIILHFPITFISIV